MKIKDPKAMRALAHPLRIQLLELLAVHGAATATRLGELAGESPSNCSFHLRVLATHGYIERVPAGNARDRPWQLADIEQTWDSAQPDEDGRSAATALSQAFLDWEHARMKAAAAAGVPEPWQGRLHNGGATLWLTPEEAEQLGQAITALITPYVQRWQQPGTRPPGGRPVRLFHHAYLPPETPETPETPKTPPTGRR
ncbi:winged helix-turn-helix domain-containing protein [Nonomuraea purpurea]|uniref:Winged helix-turn-helix domain-containing protein n=1 Tax=Nonomuraea purpurea TaxID=1849276 RepID=A0ABV8GN09_9ACTN